MYMSNRQESVAVVVMTVLLIVSCSLLAGCEDRPLDHRRVMVTIVEEDPEGWIDRWEKKERRNGKYWRTWQERRVTATLVEVLHDPSGREESEVIDVDAVYEMGKAGTAVTRTADNREGFRFWIRGNWGEPGDVLYMTMERWANINGHTTGHAIKPN